MATRRKRRNLTRKQRKASRKYKRGQRKARLKHLRRAKARGWGGPGKIKKVKRHARYWAANGRRKNNPTLTVFPDVKSAAKYRYKPQIWKVLYAPEEIQAMVPKSWNIRHSTAEDLKKYPVTIDQTKRRNPGTSLAELDQQYSALARKHREIEARGEKVPLDSLLKLRDIANARLSAARIVFSTVSVKKNPRRRRR